MVNLIKTFKFNDAEVNTISTKEGLWFDVYNVSSIVGNDIIFLIDNLDASNMRKKNEKDNTLTKFEIIVNEEGLSYLLNNAENKGIANEFRLWCNAEICKLPKETSIVATDDNGGELIKTHKDNNGQVLVYARDLHKALEIKTRFSQWVTQNFKHFKKDVDFTSVVTTTLVNNGAKRDLQDYVMTIYMAEHIAMMAGTDKGYEVRDYFIKIENMWNTPEMVMKRALEFADKQVEQLKLENSEMKPKALFYDAVAASKDLIEVGDLACLLKKNGINTGRTRLYAWMRSEKYLKSQSGTKNMPTQRSMNMGIMEETISTFKDKYGLDHTNRKTMITSKGQTYFINKFLKEEGA